VREKRKKERALQTGISKVSYKTKREEKAYAKVSVPSEEVHLGGKEGLEMFMSLVINYFMQKKGGKGEGLTDSSPRAL